MPATPNYSLPYPLATDPADVPADMQELAVAVDTSLDVVDDRVDVLEPKVATLETASADYDARLDTIEPKVPAARVAPGADGQVLTTVAGAVAWAVGPGGSGAELAYASRSSRLTLTGSDQIMLSLPPVVLDGTPIVVTGFAPMFLLGEVNNSLQCTLWDGGTLLGIAWQVNQPNVGAGLVGAIDMTHRLTLPAGSHTIHWKARCSGAGNFIDAGGSYMPAGLRMSRA